LTQKILSEICKNYQFDPKTRRMTTVHRDKDGKVYAFIKGSPESVLTICSKVVENGNIVKLDANKIKNIYTTFEEMTAKSYRVLILAYEELNGEEKQEDNFPYHVTRDAILLWIVGTYDPPRPEAKKAVQFMKEANTRVVLITGDHPVTARAVARELRIGCNDDDCNNNNTAENNIRRRQKNLLGSVVSEPSSCDVMKGYLDILVSC
jgi:P-type Ca2+ transporter type 2C